MRKLRPLTIVLLFAGISLIGFIALSSYVYFKIRNIKEPLLATLESRIDGKLQIGSAQAVFFPAGINLEDVQLFAPGEKQAVATVKSAQLRFKLLPLIQRKIETRLTILDPVVHLRTPKRGPSNMERVFAPLISGKGPKKTSALDKLWWKRLAINQLTIENAHFKATQAGSSEETELKNIYIKADDIRFESSRKPAEIQIRYELPQLSKAPLELKTRLRFQEKDQSLQVEEGKFLWGPIKMDMSGSALLPSAKREDVSLDLDLKAKEISLKDLSKVLKKAPALGGKLSLGGKVSGSPFAPVVSLVLDSPAIRIKSLSLNSFHGELIKKKKPIEIKNTSFGVYGGKAKLAGQLDPGPKTSVKLKLQLNSLSLADLSGTKGNPARLSGNLNLKSKSLENPKAYSGGGVVTVGPVVLPVVDLKNKIRLAEILSAGTGLGQMVNVGLLSNSSNIIGTRIEKVKATVRVSGGNIFMNPFSLGNGHFQAQGKGKILQQKSVSAQGTFTLSRGVTRRLILDPLLRHVLTDGRQQLSFPFSLAGPIADPKVAVDSSALKGKMAKAMVVVLQRQALGRVDPQGMINSALKGTPLSDPKNPLGQILGTSPPPQQTRRTARPQQKTTNPPPQNQPSTGNSLADKLIFGR